MNRHIFLLLLPVLLLSCYGKKDGLKVSEITSEVKQRYAPDKRVALLDFSTCLSWKGVVTVKGHTNLPAAKAELFERLEKEGFTIKDSLDILPAPNLQGRHFGIVNVSVCNIRSQPKHSAELSTQALLGTPLRVWKEENGFFLVQTPDDYLGWLDSGGFVPMDSSAYQSWVQAERVVCIEDYVFAYEQADLNSPKVSDLLAGNILQSENNGEGFIQIRFPDGRTGFVLSGKVMHYQEWLATRQPDAEHLLATANEMMGRPYLWGGASGKGMDCSGYTKTVFYLNGVQLPRDANQQAAVGEAVETDSTMKNLQPGDLLFFGRKATADQKEKITHVAIYLGDGKIIHAANKVEIASLRRGDLDFAEHRLNSFVRSKRMLNSMGKNGVLLLAQSPFYAVGESLPD